jgi:hypothetical protein
MNGLLGNCCEMRGSEVLTCKETFLSARKPVLSASKSFMSATKLTPERRKNPLIDTIDKEIKR